MIKHGDTLWYIDLNEDQTISVTEHRVIGATADGRHISVLMRSPLSVTELAIGFCLKTSGVFHTEWEGRQYILYEGPKRLALQREIDRVEKHALEAWIESQNLYKYANLLNDFQQSLVHAPESASKPA